MRIKPFFLIIVLGLLNCEEIITVEDISSDNVNLLAPADNLSLSISEVNFTWESLEFADEYQLQIATPNFAVPVQFVEDTIITTTNFTKTLEPNSYQWRVKAINFGYETSYSTQNVTIED